MGGEAAAAEGDERIQFAATGSRPAEMDKVDPQPLRRGSSFRAAARRWRIADRAAAFVAGIISAATREAQRGTLFLWLPVLLGCGALIYFALPVEPPVYALGSGVAVCAIAIILSNGRPGLQRSLLAALLVLLGLVAGMLETWRAATPMLGSDITTRVTGRVLAVEPRAGGRIRLTLELLETQRPQLRYPPARVRLSARAVPAGLKPGEGVRGLARLMAPSGPVRPQAYDFSFESYFDELGAVGFFMRNPQRTELDTPAGFSQRFSSYLQAVREGLAERLRERVGGPEGEVAAALITGMRGGIPSSYNEDLRRAGLAHVLAISGLHMALAAVTIIGSARLGFAFFPGFSSRHPVRKYAAAAALLVCFLYLLVSGAGVAAQRSFLMLAVMLLAMLFDRAALTLRNLAIAALAVLIVAPHEIVGPGFQMSFAATAALIAGYAAWNANREKRSGHDGRAERQGWRAVLRFVLIYIGGLALTSLIAGVATTLYGVWHFQRASPLALGANLAAMPIVSLVVMPSAVAAMVTLPFNLDAWPLAFMGWGITTVMKIAHWFSDRTPFDATGAIPLAATLSLTGALAILTLTTTKMRFAALPLLGLGLCLIASRNLPDVFISEDARLVAVRTQDGALAVNRSRPNAFSTENWLRAAATGAVRKPEKLATGSSGELVKQSGEGGFLCNDDACVFRHPSGAVIAQIKETDAQTPRAIIAELCEIANLVIVNEARIDRGCDNGDAQMITAKDLARRGSAEVRIAASGERAPVLRVVFAIREPYRPWHEHRKFSRAARGLGPYKGR
ncbi:ComEC/Rec2 family competence protein [uncultured Nitratireductor sp.]|uniref:ComEC/Rec2 family competence protein n=1 Tax=uncultured Nitratireductor sp. TaxID=520953 RepID=UPI0025DDD265|nr:ComEC/Rec2 family competence protein [uncultured Nitratireductor sp.]